MPKANARGASNCRRREEPELKYLVRLNPRAYNPITHRVNAARVWEVEQCATRDSGRVIWHCADIRIDSTPIHELFQLQKDKPWEGTYFGKCFRGQDDVVEIHTGSPDASGN